METHGGKGVIFGKVYAHVLSGVVFDNDALKTPLLSAQRPGWAVYEADSEMAIRDGAGRHLEVNFLDVDPYGDPWPVIDSFFYSDRPRAERLCIAVNDGLGRKVKSGQSLNIASLSEVAGKYGGAWVTWNYLDAAKMLLTEKAGEAGYRLTRWAGYHCGFSGQIAHYSAVFTRAGSAR